MLKFNLFVLAGLTVIALSSCVPVLSYSTDSYVGSLDQCLDIRGTYEKGAFLYFDFFPRGLKKNITSEDKRGFEFIKEPSSGNGKIVYKKTWLTIYFLDDQHLKGILFSEDGKMASITFSMKEKETLFPYQEEKITCNENSWQKSYTQTNIGESGGDKWRIFSKITKSSADLLILDIKSDSWGGYFGLYTPSDRDGYTSYFRKVDLTVDDIRAMNDKAKRAITQYDQLATSLPPQ